MTKLLRDSEDFRAGMAYAAHTLLHSLGGGHGQQPSVPEQIEPNKCCRAAILAFALGMVEGIEDGAGRTVDPHEHPEG